MTFNHTKYISSYTETEETVLASILSVAVGLALYGNSGMLIVLYKNDKMWNSTNMLIGNLAFSGVLVSLFCMPFSLTSVLMGKWAFQEGIVCRFNAFNTSMLLLATILTHTMISVDKYFSVVKPFSRAMTVSRTWKMIFFVWLVAMLMSLGPVINFGRYAYNPTTLVCGVGFPKGKADFIYLVLLATVGFVVPNLVMGHVYLNVFLAVRKHTKRLQSSSFCSLDVVKLQKRLILTVVSSLACFLVCWTPFCVFVIMAMVVDTPDDLPHALGISAYWCGYLNSALNPLIICSMSQRFGEGLSDLTISLTHIPAHILSGIKSVFCVCRTKRSSLPSATDEFFRLPTGSYIQIEREDSPTSLIRPFTVCDCNTTSSNNASNKPGHILANGVYAIVNSPC